MKKIILVCTVIVVCVAVFGFVFLSKLKTNITNSTGGDSSGIVYDRYSPSKETKSGNINLEIYPTENNLISGRTNGNLVFINDKEVSVDKNGDFKTKLDLDEGENIIVVTAVNSNGSYWEKELIVTIPILPDALIVNEGIVKSKTGNNLIITKDKDYEFDLSEIKLRPRYWGEIAAGDIQIGDTVNIVGNLIRDLSVQKRFGVLTGKVQSIDNNVFTILHNERGNQIVTAPQKPDIKVGDEVLVQGMWDRSANIVKDVVKIIVLK